MHSLTKFGNKTNRNKEENVSSWYNTFTEVECLQMENLFNALLNNVSQFCRWGSD